MTRFEKSRIAKFHTRKASLFKKAYELQTLCGIDVCFVVHGPDNRPVTFPTKPEEAKHIINRYRASGSHKRKLHLSDIIGPRKAQVVEQEDGSRRGSKRSKYHASIAELSEDRLVALIDRLNSRIECVDSVIAYKEKEEQEEQENEQEQEQEEFEFEEEDEDLFRDKETFGDVDHHATPIPSWHPGCSIPTEMVTPVMMMDANGCQYVPVLCYVPLSSQGNYRANDYDFGTFHM